MDVNGFREKPAGMEQFNRRAAGCRVEGLLLTKPDLPMGVVIERLNLLRCGHRRAFIFLFCQPFRTLNQRIKAE